MNVPEDGDGRGIVKAIPRAESAEGKLFNPCQCDSGNDAKIAKIESRDPFESASKRQRINPFTVEDELVQNSVLFAV